MRNLKKFLALVLAMMMTFSLMITVNAATTSEFTDAESITDEFAEAIAVLEGLEVFEGYPDGTFGPKKDITRAEAATIVYRLATGDVKGEKAHLYKDYATFTDVTSDHWAAGFINYCANAEWIAGYGNGKFGPNDKVTGYQAAAMILRAVGYGKNKEFVGSGWQVQAANFSRTLGLLDNVNETNYTNTLNQPATRELVAEILFQAGLIDTVTWTPMNGYQSGDNSIQGQTNTLRGLAWQSFSLNVSNWMEVDEWGRPGYYWFKGASLKSDLSNMVAEIDAEPVLEFNDGNWKECDVAHELKISGSREYDLYVNRDTPIATGTNKYLIEATDTVTRVGGQGRVTEFYESQSHPWNHLYNPTNWSLNRRVVMIDTYLATVTKVTERVLDPAGHVIVPAYLYLNVHDGHAVGASDKNAAYAPGTARNTSEHRVSDYDANWEYTAGEKVLVQGYTNYNDSVKNHNTANVADINKAAFETNVMLSAGTNYVNDDDRTATASAYTHISVLGKAEFKTGKQTVTYWNQDKHTMNGTDYMNANTLFLDVAGTTTNTTFAWYFDEYNNIIGIDNIPDTVNYGVITSIYSAFDQGENATTGTAKAVANVLYADGTTGTINIDKFLVGTDNAPQHAPAGSQAMQANSNANNVPSPWGTAGSAELIPVYDYSNSANVMGGSPRNVTSIAVASKAGNLHVAPVASINAAEDANGNNKFGIVRHNMFKFVASTDGNVTAIEVAGTPANNGVYAGHQNAAVTQTVSKLLKSNGYIDLTNNGTPGNEVGKTADVRLDAETRIMVRASMTSGTVNTYTMDTLPGDVLLANGSEVDWADTDGDGRAEYVYVVGTVQGSVTYGLFYYNGGAAVWNGVDKTGTLTGWLNGEPNTLTFIGENSFNAVRNSQTYAGHLFAVELTNGVVTALFDNAAAGGPQLLWDYTTTTMKSTAITNFKANLYKRGNANIFEVGVLGNNPYTALTEAIYYKDVTGTPANAYEGKLVYNPNDRTVFVDSNGNGVCDGAEAQYFLNANSKVYGLGMGVTQDGAILEYLNKSTTNDVTIVYEATNAKSIVEIYVATDPNVTPPTVTPGDNSVLTLSFVPASGSTSVTVAFTNKTGNALTGVTATVKYRVAGSNNALSTLAVFTDANSVADNASASFSSSGATTLFGGGSTTTYEIFVEVTANGGYSKTSTTYTIIV